MPTLTINEMSVTVPDGTTILQAAAELGFRIPTLCYLERFPPNTSCMVCAVELDGSQRLVPSCAALAQEGMVVKTDSDAVLENRRLVLTMLLSHHTGDCDAPCTMACPASLDIPAMLRSMEAGDMETAARLALTALVLPRTLGYVCPAPCEKICRRKDHDGALAIPSLHLTASDRGGQPLLDCDPDSDRRVAVIGAGPAGLAAAFALRRRGHAVDVYDENEMQGGMLRYGVEDNRLPRQALDSDIEDAVRTGIACHSGVIVEDAGDMKRLRGDADAVIVATGARSEPSRWGLEAGSSGVSIDRDTMETSMPGVFAAGGVIREIKRMAVRAVASGLAAADRVHQYLTEESVAPPAKAINVSMGRLREGEMERFLELATDQARQVGDEERAVVPHDSVVTETARCLHCDCRARTDCALRDVSTDYGADTRTWRDKRPTFEHDLSHPEIIYEPGKCIACGLCIQVAASHNEAFGQTFLGRGIAVRVGPPLRKTLAEALAVSAGECVKVCPTGALAWRT